MEVRLEGDELEVLQARGPFPEADLVGFRVVVSQAPAMWNVIGNGDHMIHKEPYHREHGSNPERAFFLFVRSRAHCPKVYKCLALNCSDPGSSQAH